MSDTVLALNLLESCRLSDTDEKFVLTAVDFKTGKEQSNCLDQVKKSLRKFQSRDRMSSGRESDLLKHEDTFIADVKDALLADGWRPPSSQSSSNTKEKEMKQNSPIYQGKKNRLGNDGKPLRCFRCESEYHLTYDCDQKEKGTTSKGKEKKGTNAQSKKKATEQTMLSAILSEASKKYAMVCDVNVVHVQNEVTQNQKPRVLADLFAASGSQCSVLVGDEMNLRQRPKVLADVISGQGLQLSLVCELDSDESIGLEEKPRRVLADLFSTMNYDSVTTPSDLFRASEVVIGEDVNVIATKDHVASNHDDGINDFLNDEMSDFMNNESVSAPMVVSDVFPACVVTTTEQVDDKNHKELSAFIQQVDGVDEEGRIDSVTNVMIESVSKPTMLSDLLHGVSFATTENVEGSSDHLVLVSHDEKKLCFLVEEAGTRGVLDSGCAKSVTGVSWIAKYTNAISPEFAQQLALAPSSEVYQFGGGEKRASKGSVSIPTLIGDLRVFITMDVVEASIPLLIGTNSMKVGKVILNFDSNEATFFGEVVPMVEVGSGHFCVNLVSENLLTHIDDEHERDQKVLEVLLTTNDIQVSDLKKLHHYYGHTHPDKLLKFLKKAGKDTSNLRAELIKIENTCESCIRTKRRKPRPQCAIPRVDGPNEILSVDLKEWTGKGRKRYICYLIDMFSRLTTGSFIQNKQPESLVNCILLNWVKPYGLMKGIHSDIGGEISNSLVEEVAHRLGVELTTTASYSPHQNGLNERNHAVVDMMMTKMLASDAHLSPEIAFTWALNAKNSLDNQYGYSPFQLHIGVNPRLPSVTRDGPPSYENSSKSMSFVNNMNAMMLGRQQFIKAESSSSLKKALKSRLHTTIG